MPAAPTSTWIVPDASDTMWNALVNDTGAAVAVFDENGWVHFGNTIFLRMTGVNTFEEVRRLSIEQRLQHNMAEERLAILRDVVRTGRPLMLKDLRAGKALVINRCRSPASCARRLASL